MTTQKTPSKPSNVYTDGRTTEAREKIARPRIGGDAPNLADIVNAAGRAINNEVLDIEGNSRTRGLNDTESKRLLRAIQGLTALSKEDRERAASQREAAGARSTGDLLAVVASVYGPEVAALLSSIPVVALGAAQIETNRDNAPALPTSPAPSNRDKPPGLVIIRRGASSPSEEPSVVSSPQANDARTSSNETEK